MRQSEDEDEDDSPIMFTIHQEIRSVYHASQRDWIVAFSGGKDSTATLQLIWHALIELPPEQRRHHVYIVGNDTLVEDPAMAARLRLSLARINAAAASEAESLRQRYPEYQGACEPLFSAHLLQPELHQRFFFLLIGKGFPAPTVHSRWCVSRLKLEPAERFIKEHISRVGEVVITLGVREEESTNRARTLRKYALPGQLLRRHSSMRGASVYAPIEVWTKDEVWAYLFQVKSPWGDTNRDLAAIYQASSGECPLVTDRTVPSCAGGRMGCWCCTVVSENRSLMNRVDQGEEWLIPLLQFREHLMDTTNPEHKHLYRSLEARGTHSIQLNRQGQPSYRCYTLETRQDLLRRLLLAQEQIRREGPDPHMELIDFEELCAIRGVWRSEGDWEDSLPRIYREVTGRNEPWPHQEDESWKNAATRETLLYHCSRHGLPPELVMELLELVLAFQRQADQNSKEGRDTDASFQPLFDQDPRQQGQQQAMQALVTSVAALLRRDWRDSQVRLSEVVAQYEAAQQQGEQPSARSIFSPTRRVQNK
jgi:DNA sulfur modification protein DndC